MVADVEVWEYNGVEVDAEAGMRVGANVEMLEGERRMVGGDEDGAEIGSLRLDGEWAEYTDGEYMSEKRRNGGGGGGCWDTTTTSDDGQVGVDLVA